MAKGYTTTDARKFKRYFGLDISAYWESPAFLGLDIVKLDDHLQTPDNISTYEHIAQIASIEAANFVTELLQR